MQGPLRAMNLVILGGFPYPRGMADTKRVQNIIDGLKGDPELSIQVMVLRQSSRLNELSGVYQGTWYQTVMGDLLRMKMLLLSPLLHVRARRMVERLFAPGCRNLLYVYGPPGVENLPTVMHARRIGFRVVFDIVEDDDLARGISRSPWRRLKNSLDRRTTERIGSLADGVVVISSHLERKFTSLTSGRIPIHRLPVSVRMEHFPPPTSRRGRVSFFYAGSFGVKDGLPVLIEAFDQLAARRDDIELVLTGVGSEEDMAAFRKRIALTAHRDRIIYRGYLNDSDYYHAINAADILCMTRADIGYAHAGFPFKLGEYLATGKPVIASAVSDIPDLVRDRHDAILVTPGSRDSFVAAAQYLLAHPYEAQSMGANGRLLAQRLFDYRVQGKELRDFLDRVAPSR